jgi:predicted nucleotidyltransferase
MVSITNTQLDIIGYLINREEPQSIRGIARDLKKSYALVYNNIEDLKRNEIILKENIPPAQIIKLNKYAPVEIFIKAENKRTDFFLDKNGWAKIFVDDVISDCNDVFFVLIIFGSYAKNKATKKSDLDLLAVVQKKEDMGKMEAVLKNTYTLIKKHIIVVDQKIFLEMISKSQEFNVGNEAKKKHIILYGAEQYHQLVKKVR